MATPRVVLDTNLYVNVLLSPNPEGSAVYFILNSAALGQIELILPVDVLSEMAVVLSERPHLRRRVTRAEFEGLIGWLSEFATTASALDFVPPSIVRDQKDDYLVALVVMHGATYLVTRDNDLLSLREARGIQMANPVDFVAMLRRGH